MDTYPLDHLVYAVPNVDAAVADLELRSEVSASRGGEHVGIGTRNHLAALGTDCYLEVIGPDEGQPSPARPRPFGVGEGRPPRLATWAVKCDEMETTITRLRRAGYEAGQPSSMSRRTPEGEVLGWTLAVPPRGGEFAGVMPFLIDWHGSPSPATTAAQGLTLTRLHLEHPRLEKLCELLRLVGAVPGSPWLAVEQGEIPNLTASVEGRRGQVFLR